MARSRWKTILCVVIAMSAWFAIVVAMPLFGIGGFKVANTSASAFVEAARRASQDHRGNLALILIEDGKIAQTHAMSIGKPVTNDTMFQMASVSKWVTAWGVMTLVDGGKIELDAPVSRYLTRWKLPPSEYPADAVTVRSLLSHTAGLNDGLGYCGFAPGKPIETLEASLTKAADACPLRTGAVHIGDQPGKWRYSGGGYTLLQLLIEEVSGEPFADYMQRAVLTPLGMTRSTFRTGAQGFGDIAEFFDGVGKPAPHYHYTAAAAASLYTSANDMARFALAHMDGDGGEKPGRNVLLPQSVAALRSHQASIMGTPHWGLGTYLYATSKSGDMIYGHDGGNIPAVNTSVRIEAATGDAIIALSTGGTGLASRLAGNWTRLRRANITPPMVHGALMRVMSPAEALPTLGFIATGWAAIWLVAFLFGRHRKQTIK